MNRQENHICICVCTYQRPRLLARLLDTLGDQVTEASFTHSIVVVDNDVRQSAEGIVAAFHERSPIPVLYVVEPEQNIAVARNRAVLEARGNLVAFIDDDETPELEWLIRLYRALTRYDADGVLGPVRAHFETEPPRWLAESGIVDRKEFSTGAQLTRAADMRTGNVMLSAGMFNDDSSLFDLRYGETGGEDVDFFSRMLRRGRRFVWCNEAPVYETVPPHRMTRTYQLRRALLRGSVAAGRDRPGVVSISKSIIASVLYTAILPFSILVGHHRFMRYLVKDCDHIGKLLALCGIKPVEGRSLETDRTSP